jgi:hypothetical protein
MILLPYPAPPLWPNKRAHWAKKARETKKHRAWAHGAALAAKPSADGEPIPVRITLYPKPKGPAPDKDNVVASAKAYLDGIAEAMGINDRAFASPIVRISGERLSQMGIEIGKA